MPEIQYVIGDVVEAFKAGDIKTIAHQTNCFSRMKSGVAGAIAKEFPEVIKEDFHFHENEPMKKLGDVCFVKTRCGIVVNLYGQYRYGREPGRRYTDYYALRQACAKANLIFSICSKPTKLGIPKIGAGLGGGDWNIIVNILQEEFLSAKIYCYILSENDLP